MKIKNMTISAMFVAIGVLGSQIIYIPIGASKCFPVQHTINIISAISLGPVYSVGIAFSISLLRNVLGTGSLLAFPGSMIGALIAGLLFRITSKKEMAILGEVFGTGILGGIMAFPIAKFILGKDVAALFYVVPFLISTIGGSGIAYAMLKVLDLGKISKKISQKWNTGLILINKSGGYVINILKNKIKHRKILKKVKICTKKDRYILYLITILE